MPIVKEQDVVPFRNRVKEYAVKIGMSLVNQTKLITAASELVRNMLKYGGGGQTVIEVVSQGRDSGIRLTFVDACVQRRKRPLRHEFNLGSQQFQRGFFAERAPLALNRHSRFVCH